MSKRYGSAFRTFPLHQALSVIARASEAIHLSTRWSADEAPKPVVQQLFRGQIGECAEAEPWIASLR
jgi:hypothetical protein